MRVQKVQKVQRVRPSLLLSHRLRGEGGTQYQRGPRPQVSEGSEGSERKVDGPSGRGLWPPVGGKLCSLRSGGDSAYGAEGGGLPLRAMLIKSALRDLLSVSYSMISILVISRYAAPPIRLRRTFSTGKRVTRFSGRFAPLRIVFPCHPIRGTEQIALCFPAEAHGSMAKHP